MNAKKVVSVLFIMAAIMQPVLIKAQGRSQSDGATVARPASDWMRVKLDENASNVRNGVEFYSKKSSCNSVKVTLVKLVNTNSYAVKVSCKQSAFSPIINILVPALGTIEGSCEVTEGNLAKLVITPLETKTNEEKKKNNSYLKSSIVVSKIQ